MAGNRNSVNSTSVQAYNYSYLLPLTSPSQKSTFLGKCWTLITQLKHDLYILCLKVKRVCGLFDKTIPLTVPEAIDSIKGRVIKLRAEEQTISQEINKISLTTDSLKPLISLLEKDIAKLESLETSYAEINTLEQYIPKKGEERDAFEAAVGDVRQGTGKLVTLLSEKMESSLKHEHLTDMIYNTVNSSRCYVIQHQEDIESFKDLFNKNIYDQMITLSTNYVQPSAFISEEYVKALELDVNKLKSTAEDNPVRVSGKELVPALVALKFFQYLYAFTCQYRLAEFRIKSNTSNLKVSLETIEQAKQKILSFKDIHSEVEKLQGAVDVLNKRRLILATQFRHTHLG